MGWEKKFGLKPNMKRVLLGFKLGVKPVMNDIIILTVIEPKIKKYLLLN